MLCETPFNFWLGTHETSWLGRTAVPLFISHRRLVRRKSLPIATGPWSLDSGGFSELSLFGEWRTGEAEYIRAVRRYRDEIGNLQWAAAQDWMCEPFILAKTGKTLEAHQRLTVENYITLRMIAPDLPWVPVLQGWEEADYLRHVDQYAAMGVDLLALPLVGIGSVCRRQGTWEAERIIYRLSSLGIRLHGFGFKTQGLLRCHDTLTSADSMAWSFNARKRPPLPGCTHKSCANCLRFALLWRQDLLSKIDGERSRVAQFERINPRLFTEVA